MFINRIMLSNADSKEERGYSPVIVSRTAWGYTVQTFTSDTRKIYLRSVYKNNPKYYVDHTFAGHFSYKTAMKHAENILKGKYTKGD